MNELDLDALNRGALIHHDARGTLLRVTEELIAELRACRAELADLKLTGGDHA